MGCVASSIDKEERVRVCKERKRILKQLLVFRKQFADSQLAYLRALRNTGVTLRQFTESESLEIEDAVQGRALPPSPPPPLPPSPPPPPSFSPDLRNSQNNHHLKASEEEIIDIDENGSNTPPPPTVLSTSWEYWDPFGSTSPQPDQNDKMEEQLEEENWAEANTEFEEEEQVDVIAVNDTADMIALKQQTPVIIDDNSSMTSWHTKDTADMSMVIWRSKKTLSGIVRDLDDYFVKASAGGKDVAVFLDINMADTIYQSTKESKSKRSSSTKVFSALSWSWSSKSLQSTRDAGDSCGPAEPCKPGAHCATLSKLYDAEQKLYRDIKEEELSKLEHEWKSVMLQKLEEEDHDWTKTYKTRSVVESLQSDILSRQHSISLSCSTILKLIDEELHPQLIALTSGLMCMWKRMYKCHQVQNHIAQQLNHLAYQQSMEPTTEYHRQAAAQLKSEVTSWYNSLCTLIKSQREYVSALCRWIQLTNCLVDDGQVSVSSSGVHSLSENWLIALDSLPDKMALDAIKSFLSAVHSIVLQQEEEVKLYKLSDKLERRLQRELNSLAEMEMKFEGNFTNEVTQTVLGPKHPLSMKRAKIEVLKKHVDDEKSKYVNSIQVTRAMILNNLQTTLPNVFRALMAFSNAYTVSFDTVLSHGTQVVNDERVA